MKKFFLVYSIINVWLYLLIAFSFKELNVFIWIIDLRIFFSVMQLIIGILSAFIVDVVLKKTK